MFKASLLMAVACTTAVACTSTPQPASKVASSAPPGCVQTGSRIPGNADQCTSPGRSYSQQDIDRTGKISDVGGAIALMDPSVTVHH